MNTSIRPAPGHAVAGEAPRRTQAHSGYGTAHGKVILVGEHAVVYGAPAIALPVFATTVNAILTPTSAPATIDCQVHAGSVGDSPLRLRPTITAWREAATAWGLDASTGRLSVESSIPLGRGLGSSAAVAAAVIRAVASAAGDASVDTERLHHLIQTAETVAHGTPSGLDARSVVADAPLRFQLGRASDVAVGGRFTFVVADSGVSGATSTAVSAVRALRDDHRADVDRAITEIGELTELVQMSLATGDTGALGEQMNIAHRALVRLGVSGVALDALVRAATNAGALGAKLTGGGIGGCVLALVSPEDDPYRLAHELRAAGAANVWSTSIG